MVSSVNDHKLQLELASSSGGKAGGGGSSGVAGADYRPPSLFELADIDDDVSEMPTTTVSKLATPSAGGDLDSLNTPLVLVDQINPLLASLKK